MQGHCTLQMYDALSAENGTDVFVAWFPRLFGEDYATYTFDEYPGVEFMIRDVAHTMHELLQINDNYGYDMQSFLDLIQRTGALSRPLSPALSRRTQEKCARAPPRCRAAPARAQGEFSGVACAATAQRATLYRAVARRTRRAHWSADAGLGGTAARCARMRGGGAGRGGDGHHVAAGRAARRPGASESVTAIRVGHGHPSRGSESTFSDPSPLSESAIRVNRPSRSSGFVSGIGCESGI